MSALKYQPGQTTYPRMERQDLTQSQLGAFKFIPTDEVRPVFTGAPSYFTHSPTDPRDKAYTHHKTSLRDHTVSAGSRTWTESATIPTNASGRPASDFFDKFIKPDLANSRLRLGPNALRAAVDSACCLQNQNWDIEPAHQALHADNTMYAMNHANIENEIQPYLDPSADAFLPGPSTTNDDSGTLYTSLLRALASEQQAHSVTKVALQAETAARREAEEKASKILDQNRSLLGSVSMLKSVVQHNMKTSTQVQAFETEDARKLDEGKRHNTILYDALEKLKASQLDSQKSNGRKQEQEQPETFSLDIPEAPEYASLRRHFSDSAESVTKPSPSEVEGHELIDIGTEKVGTRNGSDETWTSGNNAPMPSSGTHSEDNGFVVVGHKAKRSVQIVVKPYDVPVKWTGTSLFDDLQDKHDRIRNDESHFFKHPVRYLPKKSDKNLYRTVMVDFLPLDTTYQDVLSTIRGGAIESIQLLGPVGKSTDFKTARIVFPYELGARGVYMRGQNPGIKIKGKQVRVWQVLEPTYPRNEVLEVEIFEEGFTRMLLLENASQTALDMLPEKLQHRMKVQSVISISKSYDGLPMVEFTSIAECQRALKVLLTDPDFGGTRFDFEEDPCIDPY